MHKNPPEKFESGGFCVLLIRKDLKTYVFQCPREIQLCCDKLNLGKMGVGNRYGRRKRRAELSIFLASRSAFWRIVFDWLPADTKRALNREMQQDFSVNARVPPKSASERLENTSSAAS